MKLLEEVESDEAFSDSDDSVADADVFVSDHISVSEIEPEEDAVMQGLPVRCAVKYKGLKQPEDKKCVICCDNKNESNVMVPSEPDCDKEFYDALEDPDKKLDAPLSYLMKQKDIIITELRDKIKLLNIQIELLRKFNTPNINKDKESFKEVRTRNDESFSNSSADKQMRREHAAVVIKSREFQNNRKTY
ncbi:hypothetical protein JTB14_029651 [Gonioctena quinquepunctata]|nr:hypothetical protein JTB14_029651 [Gonioctena quinquepunctata]